MLYLLNAQNELVGCTSYCEEAKKDLKSIVASAVEVNVEKVFMLKPDLVMATSLTKQSAIEALRKLGIRVSTFPMPKSFDGICNQLVEIGKLTGKLSLAQNIVTKQKERLAGLQQTVPKGKQPKVFMEIGAKPLFAAIPNSFMNDYIIYTGGENIASDLTNGTIARESVLMKNPDVIIIVTMGIVGVDEKKTWSNYPTLQAAKNRKIFVIDSYKSCSPTPVAFVDIVEELMAMIYNKS